MSRVSKRDDTRAVVALIRRTFRLNATDEVERISTGRVMSGACALGKQVISVRRIRYALETGTLPDGPLSPPKKTYTEGQRQRLLRNVALTFRLGRGSAVIRRENEKTVRSPVCRMGWMTLSTKAVRHMLRHGKVPEGGVYPQRTERVRRSRKRKPRRQPFSESYFLGNG